MSPAIHGGRLTLHDPEHAGQVNGTRCGVKTTGGQAVEPPCSRPHIPQIIGHTLPRRSHASPAPASANPKRHVTSRHSHGPYTPRVALWYC